jgi:hypothetical protein
MTLEKPVELPSPMPYWSDDNGRRRYLLARVSGRLVPPPVMYLQGEEPARILADWIEDPSISWAAALRKDYEDLLRGRLDFQATPGETHLRELGGLLRLATMLRDRDLGSFVLNWAWPGDGKLSKRFEEIREFDTGDGRIDELVANLLDHTTGSESVPFYEALLRRSTPSLTVSLFGPLLRRDKERGKKIGWMLLEKFRMNKDSDTVTRILGMLWEKVYDRQLDPLAMDTDALSKEGRRLIAGAMRVRFQSEESRILSSWLLIGPYRDMKSRGYKAPNPAVWGANHERVRQLLEAQPA